MATSLILFDQFLTQPSHLSTIVATGGAVAQSAASISGIQPHQAGSVSMEVRGPYTSLFPRTYYVQVSIAPTGAFSTTRWRWSDTVWDVWNQENLTPVSGTWVSLSHGIEVRFLTGPTNPQFVLGDNAVFRVELKYGPAKAVDGSRDTEWRSGTVPSNSSIEWRTDLGSARKPMALVLKDHNIPSNAMITLKGKSTGFTDPPTASITIPWQSVDILALLNTSTLRYWRLGIAMTTAPTLGYLRWSEIYLGGTRAFARTFTRGFQRAREPLTVVSNGHERRGPAAWIPEGDIWSLRYEYLGTSDQAILDALRTWTIDASARLQRPFFWVYLDSETDVQLVQWTNGYIRENASNTAENLIHHTPVEFSEVVRSVI